jgi:hypothetical protein
MAAAADLTPSVSVRFLANWSGSVKWPEGAGVVSSLSVAMIDPAHLLIQRYYELYNDRRFQESAALFTPDAVIEHAPFGRTLPRGGAGYIESAERSVQAFPDAHIEVLSILPHGDTTYEVHIVATGTQQGPLDLGEYGRFEPAGAHIRVRHREVIEIHGGLITYAGVTLDVNDLVAQLTAGRSE